MPPCAVWPEPSETAMKKNWKSKKEERGDPWTT